MREDLLEILQYACQKNFYITLTTNGTLITPEIAKGIADIPYNKLHFNVSIDGFEEVNDSIRGKGVFKKALQGIENIRRADSAAGNPVRKIVINTIVHNRNLEDIPKFIEFMKDEVGVQGIQFLYLFKFGRGVPPEIEDMWIPPDRYSLLDEVAEFL